MSDSPALPRRRLLTGTAAAGAALAVGVGGSARATTGSTVMFRHGVASGDPLPRAVVLWTRVTPTDAAVPGSGIGPQVRVGWQVASDPTFQHVVRTGVVTTGPGRDHTVKVDATGLRPATSYWFRFTAAGFHSPVAKTRTAPARDAEPTGLRFGVVSCSNWQAGYFAAYRHLAARGDLDAVLHLGDYLYEYAPGEYGAGPTDIDIRSHVPAREMVTLADYRRRHGQYKTDPDLQQLHAAAPFICTWDDHESANDAWRGGAENHDPGTEGGWRQRRAGAYRAYDEWMPARMDGTAVIRDGTRLWRRLRFGLLAELSMLDLRTFRSEQVGSTDFEAIDDPARTITGDAQMAWLKQGLAGTDAQWKLVGNPVMISPVQFPPLPGAVRRGLQETMSLVPAEGVSYNTDQWDGYTADRRELVGHLADMGVLDTVFLTGDIHSAWACDLPIDAGTYPLTDTAGVELVCTSVTSNNLDDITGSPPRTTSLAVEAAIKGLNRHIKYLDFDSHGFSVLDVTPGRVQMDWYVLADRTRPDTTASFSTAWQVPTGTMRVQPASGPVPA